MGVARLHPRCVRRAALLALALSLAACATTTPAARTPVERASDQAIATGVTDALHRDPYLFDRHIHVTVVRGVVHLDGMVWSAEDYRDTRLIALQVPGVVAVVSDLDLVRSGTRK
jgi:osmotically-inducible protein OsmY